MIMQNEVKNEIKSYMARQGVKMVDLCAQLDTKFGRNGNVANLNNKLSRGTVTYAEVQEIADILGYDIQWVHPDIK